MSRNSMMGNSAPRQKSVLRDAVLTILLLLTTRVQASDPVYSGRADPPDQLLSLWYSRPAGAWLEAVPVGNGRLGGMVYGGVPTERIALNQDTLWSGGRKDCDNPQALKTLAEIRVSQPDQILVVRLTASRPGTLGFTARLGSRLHFRTQAKDDVLVLCGKAPAHADPNYHNSANPIVYATTDDGEGMKFECHLRANASEGTIIVKDDALRIEHAGSVTLLLSAVTSFNGFNRAPGRQGKDPAPIAAGSLAAAAGKPYEELLRAMDS